MIIDPEFYILIALPLIGALIGWLTNRLAIQMLFRPRNAYNFLNIKVQGLIPKRQIEIAHKVGEIVEEEILGRHLIRNEMKNIDLQPHLGSLARTIVWDKVAPRLRALPLLGSFVNNSILTQLHDIALQSMEEEASTLLEKVSEEAEKHIAIRKLVESKIENFDLDQLERVVRNLAAKEFKAIEWLGAIIGFLIGSAQMAILLIL